MIDIGPDVSLCSDESFPIAPVHNSNGTAVI